MAEVSVPKGTPEASRFFWEHMDAQLSACAKEADVSRDEPRLPLAEDALKDLVLNADEVDPDVLLAPGFAQHGYSHASHLAERLRSLLEEQVISLASLTVAQRLDVLLLAFGAFVYHDIGMMLAPNVDGAEGAAADLVAFWQEDRVRRGHDERSLIYIENVLSKRHLPGWAKYWETRYPNPPKPFGSNELLLMARVCQSHGDSDAWLDAGKLSYYEQKVGDGRVMFRDAFGGGIWQHEALDRCTGAAATLLNLCDLLDIRNDRIDVGRAEVVRQAQTPSDPSARRQRFLHWLGNKKSDLTIRSGGVTFETHGVNVATEMQGLRVALLDRAGPGGDLLRYATASEMSDALKRYLGVGPVSVRRVRGAATPWQDAEEFASRLESDWPYGVASKALGGRERTELDSLVTVPLWFGLALEDGSTTGAQALGINLSTTIALRRDGLPLEDLFEFDGEMPGRAAVVCQSAESTHHRTDSFLAALRVARSLAGGSVFGDDSSIRLHLAFKPAPLYSLLGQGEFPAGPSVILVHVGDPDPADINAMIQAVQDKPVRLLFFCKEPSLEDRLLALPHVNRVECSVSVPNVRYLATKYKHLTTNGAGGLGPGVLVPREDGEPVPKSFESVSSPGELMHLWLTEAPDGLTRVLEGMLSSEAHEPIAQGALVLLRMNEARTVGAAPVPEASVRDRYQYLKTLPGMEAMPSIDDVLRSAQFKGCLRYMRADIQPDEKTQRQVALEGLAPRLSAAARIALLMDALILVAQGEHLNPEAVDWRKIPQAVLPALKNGLPDMDVHESTGMTMAASTVIPLADIARGVLNSAERWECARTLGMLGGSVARNRGLVAFQLIYRLLRNDEDALRQDSASDPNAVLWLGQLEALCSNADVLKPTEAVAARARIEALGERFADLDEAYPEEIDRLMAFDILYTYRVLKKKQSIIPEDGSLWKLGASRGWVDLAEEIRSGSTPPAASPYADLRRRFDQLHYDTPLRYRRQSNRPSLETDRI